MEQFLRILERLLPVLTVVIPAVWAFYTYLDHQKEIARAAAAQSAKEASTRLIEARRPFLEKQLQLYFETAHVTGALITFRLGAEWDKNRTRFWELYWSELSMVEDHGVEAAMVKFGQALDDWMAIGDDTRNKPEKQSPLQEAAYELAHAMRASIEREWSGAPSPVTDLKATLNP
jgi:hypothetical protein